MLLFIGELVGLSIVTLVIISIVPFLLWVWALIDILKSDFKTDVEKIIWLLLVFFLPFLGWILYVFIGRAQRLKRYS
ncbi:PLDc N-terminal domain-containing protein [Nibribacter koreensis]|uniref:Cardiolipin synthase N-terminal domain-containing protein n=1 Tax=Nibribacter koreensis TaxID=1084519 RepID=A0ABP8F9P6_9BACT